MDRRSFLAACGIGAGGLLLPGFAGRAIAASQLTETIEIAVKKTPGRCGAQRRHRRRRHLLRRAHRPLPEPVRHHPRSQRRERRQHRIDRRRRPRHRRRRLGLRRHQRHDARCRGRRGAPGRRHRQGQRQATRPQPVQLAPIKGVGEVALDDADPSRTPWKCRSRKRSNCCSASTPRRSNAGASFVNSQLFLVNEQKYFASDRRLLHRPGRPPHLGAASRSPRSTRRPASSAPATACRRRWAWATNTWTATPPTRSSPASGVVSLRHVLRHDRGRDRGRRTGAREADGAVGQARASTTWCSTPTHLGLTIHESVGHPPELDRVLGYEANYAGTSFATLDKRESTLPVRLPTTSTSSPTRPSPARSAPSATTTKASSQAMGPDQGRHAGRLPGHRATRPTSSARTNRTAAAMPTRWSACSSSAWPTSRWSRARRR